MKDTTLNGEKRTEDFGSAGSRRLLAAGRIPAVIYGKNDPVHVSLEAREFQNKMRHFSESTLLTLKVGKKSYSVLMKDFQENVMTDSIVHVDLFEVTKGEVLRTHVPIHLEGNPAGAKFGGVLDQVTHELEVECLPKDLPESIVVDVTGLNLNESIHVEMITVPEGVKLIHAEGLTIASVKGVKEVVSAPEGEEAEGEEAEEAADEE